MSMLNELREYKIWATGENTRWMSQFNHGYQGLRRAMLIIARHFLFEEDENKPDFERAEEALLVWLGKKDSTDPELHDLYDGVKKNIESIQLTKKSDSFDKEKIINDIKRKNFTYDSNSFKFQKGKSSKANAIWIEDIIVQASVDGPLKNMCLVADIDVFDSLVKCKHDRSSIHFYKEQDRVLKFIAMYLLNGGGINNPAKINSIDLNGWFDQGRFPQNLEKDVKMCDSGEKIFNKKNYDFDEDVGNNNHLYEINDTLIKHFSIELTKDIENKVRRNPDFLKNHCVYLDKPGRIFKAEELSNFE